MDREGGTNEGGGRWWSSAPPLSPLFTLRSSPVSPATRQINGERRLNCTLFLAPRRASTTSRRLGKLPPPSPLLLLLLLLLHAFHFRKGRGYYVFQTGTNPTGKHTSRARSLPRNFPPRFPAPSRQDYAVKRSTGGGMHYVTTASRFLADYPPLCCATEFSFAPQPTYISAAGYEYESSGERERES